MSQAAPQSRHHHPHPPKKVTDSAWTLEEAVDSGFFAVAGALTLWLAVLLISKDFRASWDGILYLVVFWALIAYIGLPRLQQVLAKVYVPDYFIGRTVTSTGILGDPINLAVDGSEAQLHAAMTAAGWTRADEVTLRSSWGIIVSAVFRRSYSAAPVSPLFVFGQQQAIAYEQEVAGNASQRHHVRFWPTPEGWVLPGGRKVDWLAAGTYDRKVGLSLFTLQVTHKIDADIDRERDHIIETIQAGEPDVTVTMLDRLFTPFHTRNGGGDIVHTDGDLPIVDLTALTPAELPAPSAAPSQRRLPPPMLILAGLLSAGKAIGTLVGLILLAGGVRQSEMLPDASTAQLVQLGVSAAALVGLWVLTLLRRRWARTLLMGICTIDAVGQLAALSSTPSSQVSLLILLSAGLSLLILITVSSDDARRWVAERDRPTDSSSRDERAD